MTTSVKTLFNFITITIFASALFLSSCSKKSSEPGETLTTENEKTLSETQNSDKADEVAAKVSEDSKKELEEEAKSAQATINIKTKEKPKVDNSNVMSIQLKTGTVKIKLRPDLAPKHVERIKTLTKKGFYDGLKFHRVIEGFMAQTGDPNGNGTGGSSLPDLQAEFNSKPFDRGVVGMARAGSPHSANSQFFIMLEDGHFLNNKYTVFGEVIDGMEHVDKIKLGDRSANGAVNEPDSMIKVTVTD
jgi:peptidylprolyl isomerase